MSAGSRFLLCLSDTAKPFLETEIKKDGRWCWEYSEHEASIQSQILVRSHPVNRHCQAANIE